MKILIISRALIWVIFQNLVTFFDTVGCSVLATFHLHGLFLHDTSGTN